MNSLSGTLKKSAHDIYENIVEILVISLMVSIPILPAFFMIIPIGIIYLILLAMPCFVAGFYALTKRMDRKVFNYKLFFIGLKKYYIKGFLYGVLMVLFFTILVSSWWYYIKTKTILSFTIAMFQSYFFVMISMSQMYTISILIRENLSLGQCINKSIKLFLDNPIYTIGTLIQIIDLSILLILTVVSVPMLFPGVVSIFLINIYDNLLLKYKTKSKEVLS
ncbi:hypothetical protein [Clostridium tetanomorphum]|uniref:DUF624 domain-containing protein n=1 Tax=Clostridium tetanomorphum TaxID=1553 RepID=A0A923ED44_CLOTT|nr:hypothetical protein [Clostridium tetanomorphum]MBC2398390.1 hypothetical protein [Clostridium tetanomorphum]NRZ95482.1 putative membrane protein YesL [Clostridium tetanomorphum]